MNDVFEMMTIIEGRSKEQETIISKQWMVYAQGPLVDGNLIDMAQQLILCD